MHKPVESTGVARFSLGVRRGHPNKQHDFHSNRWA